MFTFQSKVLALIKQIPKGKVTTYKILTEKLNTKAYRAVGQALKHNTTPIKAPCHRVINSNGSLGGYNGPSEKNIKKKIQLLKKEGIIIQDYKIDLNKYSFSDI